MSLIEVLDGHDDFLLRLPRDLTRRERIWLDGDGHLDLPRMRRGGFAGGFFAIYVPSPQAQARAGHDAAVARRSITSRGIARPTRSNEAVLGTLARLGSVSCQHTPPPP